MLPDSIIPSPTSTATGTKTLVPPPAPPIITSSEGNPSNRIERFIVEVRSFTQAQDKSFLLQTQGNNGQLTLKNDFSLPEGTKLTLETSTNHRFSHSNALLPQLNIVEIDLPKTATTTHPKIIELAKNGLIEQLIKPFIAARQIPDSASAQQNSPIYNKSLLQSAQTAMATQTRLSPLIQLTHQLSANNTGIPAAVRVLFDQWLQQLPNSTQLQQGEGVRQSLLNSGITFERQLLALLQPHLNQALSASKVPTSTEHFLNTLTVQGARASTEQQIQQAIHLENPMRGQAIKDLLELVKARLETPQPVLPKLPNLLQHLLTTDTKAVLSRALLIWANSHQALPNHPISSPQESMHPAFKLLQRALNSIETEQGHWGLRQQSGNTALQLQLPLFFQHQHQLQEVRVVLEKEEEKKPNSTKKTIRWRLRLYFNLQHLGPLDVDLELQLPKIKACFWSRQSDTLALLNQQLQPLRQQLTALGAEVEDLRVQHGQLPEPTRNRIEQRLIDVHS